MTRTAFEPHDRAGLAAAKRLLRPTLPGAILTDRLLACLGALVGIGVTALMCGLAFGNGLKLPLLPLLVAPMGASAVLLYAVPSSPLAQPWSIVGGNTVSALVGITVARLVPDAILAAAVAVALAIAAMSLLRCLHPPGGAAALTAVLGGPAVIAAGFGFAFVPVGLNSAVLVLMGWLFHKVARRHVYPYVAVVVPARPGSADPDGEAGLRTEDIDRALEDLGESFDINRGALDLLLRQSERRARERLSGAPA